MQAVEADPLEVTVDVERRVLSAPAAGIESSSSRWTTPPGSGSWRGSTTSASPCATPTPSTCSRPGDPSLDAVGARRLTGP